MLTLSIVLLLLGTVFLLLELHVPGFGICGIAGVIFIVASCALTVMKIPFGPLIVAAELGGLGVFTYFVFMYIKKRQLYGKLILDETLNFEQKDVGDLDRFVGKEGLTKTSLKPFGKVLFNGVEMDAWADSTYIAEEVKVKVVDVLNNKIIVKPVNAN